MIENILPKSWSWQPIIELLANNSNGKPFQQGWSPQCENHPADENTWGVLKTTAIQDGQFLDFENKKLPETIEPRPHLEITTGDILMTCAGPRNRCGVVCFVKATRPKLLMSGKMYRFRPNPSLLDAKFLEAFLRSHEAQLAIDTMKTGISDSGLNLTHGRFAELRIPFPPLNEQKRIVAKIEELFSELDNGIASLKTAREQLKVYRQAILKHAFEGKLTAKWREENADKLETPEQLLARIQQERDTRYRQQLEAWKSAVKVWEVEGKEGKKPKKPAIFKPMPTISEDEISVLPKPPVGWRYVRLAEISEIGSGMSVSQNRKLKNPIEIAYLRVANVQRGLLDLSEIKTMLVEKEALKDLLLENGDILFNEGGDRDKLGRGWIWESQIEPCITQNHVFRASPFIKNEFHSKFISHWGNSFGKNYFEKGGKQTTNLASINKTVLSNFPVPLPSFEEQNQIIAMLDDAMSQIDALESEIEKGLQRADILCQSILKKAFSGQLVPQDPNDEPASELLARIKSEKAQQKQQTNKSITIHRRNKVSKETKIENCPIDI